ncbi:MAG: prepilin-type N-terminal cleavage/methylation domain-containing protein [Novosphingobium sp.]|uniref:PulJ/GspJ family protein n=1 Tax=Novosphingobium sp. TaxID=1874826 RepID=UPI00301890AE
MTAALHPRNGARTRDAGFTLAEMLVSLALFAMISALIAAVVDLIARLDTASRRRGEAVAEIVSAQTLIRARLEQMRALIDSRGLGDSISFVGEHGELTFVAPGFAAEGPHEAQAIRLRRTNQGRIVIYSVPVLSGSDIHSPSVEGWRAAPLLDKVQWMELAYFGPDRLTGRDVWQDRWVDRAQPPRLVRVRLGFAEGDPRSWPVLLVRPLSGVRLSCQDGRRSADCGADK